MGWNDRSPNPLDPAADPILPQADTSQGHDIPTGVSPTTAKLQDWIAWLRDNGVFYTAPGVVANDITIGGDLTVTGDSEISGTLDVGSDAAVGGDLSIGGDVTSPVEFQEMIGARGGFSVYRSSHGTLSSNISISDSSYLHSFDGASSSVDVALQFDATTPGLIHCYCTSASLANAIEFRYTGILVGTWPAGANRPFVTFVMGALLPEPISHAGTNF